MGLMMMVFLSTKEEEWLLTRPFFTAPHHRHICRPSYNQHKRPPHRSFISYRFEQPALPYRRGQQNYNTVDDKDWISLLVAVFGIPVFAAVYAYEYVSSSEASGSLRRVRGGGGAAGSSPAPTITTATSSSNQPNELPRQFVKGLQSIVGRENVFEDWEE